MRSIEPGEADSNPFGAVYQGSCEGGSGVEVSRVGKVEDGVVKRKTNSSCVKNILKVQIVRLLRRS